MQRLAARIDHNGLTIPGCHYCDGAAEQPSGIFRRLSLISLLPSAAKTNVDSSQRYSTTFFFCTAQQNFGFIRHDGKLSDSGCFESLEHTSAIHCFERRQRNRSKCIQHILFYGGRISAYLYRINMFGRIKKLLKYKYYRKQFCLRN